MTFSPAETVSRVRESVGNCVIFTSTNLHVNENGKIFGFLIVGRGEFNFFLSFLKKKNHQLFFCAQTEKNRRFLLVHRDWLDRQTIIDG